jgi:hypothetical protein
MRCVPAASPFRISTRLYHMDDINLSFIHILRTVRVSRYSLASTQQYACAKFIYHPSSIKLSQAYNTFFIMLNISAWWIVGFSNYTKSEEPLAQSMLTCAYFMK